MKKALFALVSAVVAVASTAYADSTGLVGQTITPKPLPPMTDIRKLEYANGYFDCGGSMLANGLSITTLRKGAKTSCEKGTLVYALTKSSNNNKTHEFLDTVDVTMRKGEGVLYSDCEGADVVLTKAVDVEVYTKHIKAWKIAGNKFVPMTDLKNIRCKNGGWGV
jgi:hypothetical protein